MNVIQRVNRLLLLTCAPFLGTLLWLLYVQVSVQLPDDFASVQQDSLLFSREDSEALKERLDIANRDAEQIKFVIDKYYSLYEKSSSEVSSMSQQAAVTIMKPGLIYDQRITEKLGAPVRHASSDHIDAKLFTLQEERYQGYALKIQLKSERAIQLVIGQDQLGGSETTLDAANRYGALAGINAGGYTDDANGRKYPLDTTIIGGKYINGFFPTSNDSVFIGLNKDRKLIGGKFRRQEELDQLSPLMGTTFVPALLQNGKKLIIPSKWQTSPARSARTVVGNYKDDQLLFLVTDGQDGQSNSGATLAELQDKLLKLGVINAYNLDGGGSSTLVFEGAVINRPSDGKLRPLATHFLFFR